jgi:NADPH-dependent 2,4-dienoyl-CoA reductase/sulfur reductase-like enzyme
LACVQNPAAGREKRLGIGTLKPATTKKKVLVIGGGPAGLKAAEIAAQRGHKVILYEKESELGGQVRLAAKTSIQQEFGEITRYLIYQVTKLGVKINLGQEATLETTLAENPDAVVVATGCQPVRTQFVRRQLSEEIIPGVDQDNVVSVWDVLEGRVKVGQNVVIVDDERHYRTLATADFLASQGKRVQIVTPERDPISERIGTIDHYLLYRRLREREIKVNTLTLVKAISGSALTVIESITGKERIIDDVDTVVWATGAKANDEIYFALKGKVKELYRVGDCVAPRLIEFAIWEGEKVGRTL